MARKLQLSLEEFHGYDTTYVVSIRLDQQFGTIFAGVLSETVMGHTVAEVESKVQDIINAHEQLVFNDFILLDIGVPLGELTMVPVSVCTGIQTIDGQTMPCRLTDGLLIIHPGTSCKASKQERPASWILELDTRSNRTILSTLVDQAHNAALACTTADTALETRRTGGPTTRQPVIYEEEIPEQNNE